MLSVIIPSWAQTAEAAEKTEQNIERIWKVASLPTEVLLIDNGSAYRRPYRISAGVWWPKNRGIAPAWNEGVRLAHGDHLAFLTTSVTVEPGWDVALADAAHTGHIAFPLTDEGDGFKPHRAGTGIAGWCWMMSLPTAHRIGEFDESFVPAWYEDTDYFHRALDLGVQLVSVPAAHVRHKAGMSTSNVPNRDWLFLSNRYRYAWKHSVPPDQPPPFWRKPLPEFLPSASSR